MKFYSGSAGAARSYVEADRSRVDDYYLAEGTGLAEHLIATVSVDGEVASLLVSEGGTLDGDAYEQWVAGYDAEGQAKGRLRTDAKGLRFLEVVVNGPKTWSLAAALHPEIGAAYDAAQDRAAREIVGWLAEHSSTRVGPRGRQVQVPVEKLEAAVVRHHTSRAGDPHRHLHLQINVRVFGAGKWRGLHSMGVVDSIEAINGIGHAAVACDPDFRAALAQHGYTLNPETNEVEQLAPFAGAFSARAAQIGRNVARYEAEWRRENPGQEPGPKLRQAWDRRAWAFDRPDKIVPTAGTDLTRRWVDELTELGFTALSTPVAVPAVAIGQLDRDLMVDVVLTRLAARRSAWNGADIRGEVEKLLPSVDLVVDPVVRRELAEDLTARTLAQSVPLLERDDVPAHVRALTSTRVLEVEADIVDRIRVRAQPGVGLVPADQRHVPPYSRTYRTLTAKSVEALLGEIQFGEVPLDPAQRRVAKALSVDGRALVVVEGAAGAGKTATLAAARELTEMQRRRMVVVAPTLKAAKVAAFQIGTSAYSAAKLVHQYGYRWDDDGHWTRHDVDPEEIDSHARLRPGDILLVDEAGMLDQDTARALFTIVDDTGARLALVGDRHQLPAVGRGGTLDLATRWTQAENHLELDTVHRFTDPEYAALTLHMRTGHDPGAVFDQLLARGDILIHPTDSERTAVLAAHGADGALVIADTRDQVADLNATIRDQRAHSPKMAAAPIAPSVATSAGERLGVGDQVATRRNDRALDVANRDRWIITTINEDDSIDVHGSSGRRTLPAEYVREHVELAYATTVYGAQGDTVNRAHLALGEHTGAASAYVAMTRGRHHNTAHLVADTTADARDQWVATFSRDRADLGPTHARHTAAEDIDRYGPQAPRPEPRAKTPLHTEHEREHWGPGTSPGTGISR